MILMGQNRKPIEIREPTDCYAARTGTLGIVEIGSHLTGSTIEHGWFPRLEEGEEWLVYRARCVDAAVAAFRAEGCYMLDGEHDA